MSFTNEEIRFLDDVLTNLIQGYASPFFTKLAIIFTQIGSWYVEILVLLIMASYLLIRLKHIWDTVILFSCLLGTWLLSLTMKMTFRRQRPTLEHLVEVQGYSFPSGHAMTATAFYGIIGYILWLNLRKVTNLSWLVPIFTFILILLIGSSRVYLGVHFPSDVLAGFATGGVWLIICIYVLRNVRYFKSGK